MVRTRKTRKRPTNRIEKMKLKIIPVTLKKKNGKEERQQKFYCVICEKESSGTHKCSVCDRSVHAICGSYSEDSEGFGLKVTRNICVRKNRINIAREGAKSGQEQRAQKIVSLSPTQDLQLLILGQMWWTGCLTLVEDV